MTRAYHFDVREESATVFVLIVLLSRCCPALVLHVLRIPRVQLQAQSLHQSVGAPAVCMSTVTLIAYDGHCKSTQE